MEGIADPHTPGFSSFNLSVTRKFHNFLLHSNMLKLGSSKPWPDALEAISGTRQMSADALLEYFQPLMEWLKEENQKNGVTIGWEEKCPEGYMPDSASKSHYLSLPPLCAGHFPLYFSTVTFCKNIDWQNKTELRTV